MPSRMKYLMVVAALVVCATALYSYVPQTIVIDGTNDFLVANLMDPDGLDAQFTNIDLDSVYVTNDANKLYVGFIHDQGGWSTVQLGVHISTNDATGGTTDSWGRAIAWNTAPRKPDYQAYVNLDNSWEELREWNAGGGTWDALYQGINSMTWETSTSFNELALNLSDLGVSLGDTIYMEVVVTQDGSTKGPLDAMANDDQQLSTPGGTTWDVASPVELDSMVMYILQVTGDTDPPTVQAIADDEPGSIVEAGIDDFVLIFSEAVDEVTAENAGNYALTGTAAAIDSVVRNPGQPDRVRIYLDTTIGPQSSFYSVKVTGVKDLNNNTIVDNDTTNVGCFFLKGLHFIAKMSNHFLTHSFPTDTVSVEGGLPPLTWGPCDNAILTDTGGDVFVGDVVFTMNGTGCHTGSPSATANLEWKLNHQCGEYESISNRQHTLSSANGARDTLEVWWDDLDPTQFTTHPIDVLLFCDANSMSPTGTDTVAVNGSVFPLTFDVPSLNEMADDGVAPDGAAGDGVYTMLIRFPTNSFKGVGYKYLFNGVYECQTEGNREVYLNDAAYDTVGGAMGPLVMPLQFYDRCSTIGRDVEVIFTVNALWLYPAGSDTIAVNGGVAPLDWNVPSVTEMKDDGVAPDATAGDLVYTGSVIFPDSSSKYVEYKYLFNSTYECTTQSNRYFYVDDAFNATGNPQALELDNWNLCEATGIDDTPTARFALHQNYPNPFNPTTTISFTTDKAGHATLRVYNVRGAYVATILDGYVQAGDVRAVWNATDRFGREMASGVYFYDLRINGQRATRKMVLLR